MKGKGFMRNFLAAIFGILLYLCSLLNAQLNPAMSLQAAGYTLDEPSLVRALHDARPSVRSQAATIISEERYSSALPALKKAADREHNENVLLAMLISSDALGSTDAGLGLHKLCKSSDQTVIIIAANYLQRMGDNSCVEDVSELLNSPYAGVRESALLYLTHIVVMPSSASSSLGPVLLRIVRVDPDAHDVELASQVIEKIGDEKTKAEYEHGRK